MAVGPSTGGDWTLPTPTTTAEPEAIAYVDDELNLLGSMLLDGVTITEHLRADDFYNTEHGLIYEAIRETGGGFSNVVERLRRRDQLERVGGLSRLTGLMADANPRQLVRNVRQVRAASRRRALLEAGSRIAIVAREESDPETAEAKALTILRETIIRHR